MTTDSPVGATACEGVLIGSQPWKRVHCNGCADAAAIRGQLAEATEQLRLARVARDSFEALALTNGEAARTAPEPVNPPATSIPADCNCCWLPGDGIPHDEDCATRTTAAGTAPKGEK